MTSALKREVLQLIEQRGKMTRVEVFAQFELVAPRYIKQALTDLEEERKIVAGPLEVAPARAARVLREAEAAAAAAMPSPPPMAPKRPKAQPPLAPKILTLFKPGEVLYPQEIIAAIPGSTPQTVRDALAVMKRKGLLENESWRGYWLPGTRRVGQRA